MTSSVEAASSAEAAEVWVASAEAVEVQAVASEDFPVEEDPQEAEEAPALGKVNKKMTRGMTSGFLMGILKEISKLSHPYLISQLLYPFDFDDFVIFAQGDCIP